MRNNYEETPVKGFGEKILERFGWFQGRGLGKSAVGEVPVYLNYIGREERNGVGSERATILQKKSKFEIGMAVEVTGGKHQGVFGVLFQIEDDYALVEIQNNDTKLKVPIIYLQQSTVTQQPALLQEKKDLKWVLPGLKIKIRSKNAHNGSLYNCKGIVEDVIDSFRFSVRVGKKIVDDLREKDVQTCVPRVGEMARLVKGPGKGDVCKVIEKGKGWVLIQIMEEIEKVKENDICDFLHE
jgi:hypothetical protein